MSPAKSPLRYDGGVVLDAEGRRVAQAIREALSGFKPSERDDNLREIVRRWNGLEECQAVLHDLNEERGIKQLWAVSIKDDGGEIQDEEISVRADREDVPQVALEYVTGLFPDYDFVTWRCRAYAMIDRASGLLEVDHKQTMDFSLQLPNTVVLDPPRRRR